MSNPSFECGLVAPRPVVTMARTRALGLALAAAAGIVVATPAAAQNPTLVISQVYGGRRRERGPAPERLRRDPRPHDARL